MPFRNVSYRCIRFTPLGAKYLILDDFHFRINPQIINYNGLSFHTSMGLPELGRAATYRPPGRSSGLATATPTAEHPQSYSLNKSKSEINDHMLVCNLRLFIETNFPVSLNYSESRSAQAKNQRSSGLLQLESHFRKLERRAVERGALGRSWLLP
jgi:hypothetical protein